VWILIVVSVKLPVAWAWVLKVLKDSLGWVHLALKDSALKQSWFGTPSKRSQSQSLQGPSCTETLDLGDLEMGLSFPAINAYVYKSQWSKERIQRSMSGTVRLDDSKSNFFIKKNIDFA
jgi:hypothetical protein